MKIHKQDKKCWNNNDPTPEKSEKDSVQKKHSKQYIYLYMI